MKRNIKVAGQFFIFFLIFFVLLALIQQFEKTDPNASIKSMFDAFWFSVVTLTTVGYGDFYPVTTPGKLLGLVLILLSLGLLSYVIGQITSKIQNYMEKKKLGHFGTKFKNHVVIVGWDQFGKLIAEQILRAGHKISVLTKNKNDIDLILEQFGENTFAVFGELEAGDTLRKAGIEQAASVLLNFEEDSEALVYLINLRKLQPQINVVVSLKNAQLKETFYSAGATYVVPEKDISSKLIASFVFEPDVARFTEDLITTATDESAYDIFEFRVNERNPFSGVEYLDAFIDMKKKHDATLIGICKYDGTDHSLVKNPPNNLKIEVNDYLIMITNGVVKKNIESLFGVGEGRLVKIVDE